MDSLRLINKGDKDMAMRKSFLNLGLGVVGGCLAFVAIDAIRGDDATPASHLEIASPAAVRPVSLASNAALPVEGQVV